MLEWSNSCVFGHFAAKNVEKKLFVLLKCFTLIYAVHCSVSLQRSGSDRRVGWAGGGRGRHVLVAWDGAD